MLASGEVGICSSGALLRCPQLAHPSAPKVTGRTADRCGRNLSRSFLNPLPCPWLGHFTEAESGEIGHCHGQKCARRLGELAQPPDHCDDSVFWGKAVPCHNRAQRFQHHVYSFEGVRIYITNRPKGGLQTSSQGPTWGSTFWDCGVQFRWVVIGRE